MISNREPITPLPSIKLNEIPKYFFNDIDTNSLAFDRLLQSLNEQIKLFNQTSLVNQYNVLLQILHTLFEQIAKDEIPEGTKKFFKQWLDKGEIFSKTLFLSNRFYQSSYKISESIKSENKSEKIDDIIKKIQKKIDRYSACPETLKNLIKNCKNTFKSDTKINQYALMRKVSYRMPAFKEVLFNLLFNKENTSKEIGQILDAIHACDELLIFSDKFLEEDKFLKSVARNRTELNAKIQDIFDNLNYQDFCALLVGEKNYFVENKRFAENVNFELVGGATNLVWKLSLNDSDSEKTNTVVIKVYPCNDEYDENISESFKIQSIFGDSAYQVLGKDYGFREISNIGKNGELQIKGFVRCSESLIRCTEYFDLGNVQKKQGAFTKKHRKMHGINLNEANESIFEEILSLSISMCGFAYQSINLNIVYIDMKPSNIFMLMGVLNNLSNIPRIRLPDDKTMRYFPDLSKITWGALKRAGVTPKYLPPEINPNKISDDAFVNFERILRYMVGLCMCELAYGTNDNMQNSNLLEHRKFANEHVQFQKIIKALMKLDPSERMDLCDAKSELIKLLEKIRNDKSHKLIASSKQTKEGRPKKENSMAFANLRTSSTTLIINKRLVPSELSKEEEKNRAKKIQEQVENYNKHVTPVPMICSPKERRVTFPMQDNALNKQLHTELKLLFQSYPSSPPLPTNAHAKSSIKTPASPTRVENKKESKKLRRTPTMR